MSFSSKSAVSSAAEWVVANRAEVVSAIGAVVVGTAIILALAALIVGTGGLAAIGVAAMAIAKGQAPWSVSARA